MTQPTNKQWINWLTTDVKKFNLEREKDSYRRIDLSEANLSGKHLTEAKLTNVKLRAANLAKTNLSGANLSGANLLMANLRGANLTGANLTGAYLSFADIRGAKIDYASWPIWCGGMDVVMDEDQVKGLLFIQLRNLEYNNSINGFKGLDIPQKLKNWVNTWSRTSVYNLKELNPK